MWNLWETVDFMIFITLIYSFYKVILHFIYGHR
jgi:hypothetical protein